MEDFSEKNKLKQEIINMTMELMHRDLENSYNQFKVTFNKLYKNSTEETKFANLKSLVSDSVKHLIAHLPQEQQSFNEALSILDKHYAKRKFCEDGISEKLGELNITIKNDSETLCDCNTNRVQRNYNRPITFWELQRNKKQNKSNHYGNTTYKHNKSHYSNNPTQHTPAVKSNSSSTRRTNEKEKDLKIKCLVCGKHHFTRFCPLVEEAEDKLAILTKHRVCIYCAGHKYERNHPCRRKDKLKCNMCNGQHLSILHSERPSKKYF